MNPNQLLCELLNNSNLSRKEKLVLMMGLKKSSSLEDGYAVFTLNDGSTVSISENNSAIPL